MLRTVARLGLMVAVSGIWGSTQAHGTQVDSDIRLSVFSADVTIPLGHRCMGVLPIKATHVVDPLEAHGFVLQGAGEPIVFVAIDWCEIRNDAYDAWRNAIAAAAGTSPQRVLVTSLHQHDAPVVDLTAQRLLDEVGLEQELCDPAFHRQCVERVAASVRGSLAKTSIVTHVGLGKARVERIASNRRVRTLDGGVHFGRGSSSGSDPDLASRPEGLIDPYLQTISFYNGETQLVALSTYAVHPMSYYGRGAVSADFVGAARRLRQQETGDALQIYASGCSGDTTAGKYNAGQPENRSRLAGRLCQAMRDAEQATRKFPLRAVNFRHASVALDFREGESHTEQTLRSTLIDSSADVKDRILAAMGLSSRIRVTRGQPIDVPCIDFGEAELVLLPAEAFVGYQVMAQQMRPDVQVLCVGYGECWPGYIPTQAACDDAFSNTWLWVDCNSEPKMRAALAEVLQPSGDFELASGEWGRIALSPARREQCLAVLREGLASDEFWPAMHAAEGLSLAGRGAEVRDALEGRLPAEDDAQRRCGLARELVRSGARQYVSALLEILASDDPHGHVHAAESLYKIGEVGSGRELRRACDEADNASLVIMASAALARGGSPVALARLRETLAGGDATARKLAAWVLGRIGDPSDIPVIHRQLVRAADAVDRAYFEHALAALGDDRGVAALARNLLASDPAIRTYAATFAGDARMAHVAQPLLELLDDEHLDVRIRAAQSLLVLAGPPPPDSSEDIRRQVYRATESHPRLTEGSVVEKRDGSLLFAVTQFDKTSSDFAPARIVGRISRDQGRTWGPAQLLQDNTGSMNVMSVTLRRLENGHNGMNSLGMFFLQKNGFDDLDVYLRVSKDDGNTFGEPIAVTSAAGYHVMNNDRVCRLSSGRLLAPVASTRDVKEENHFIAYCQISDDAGRTWRRGRGHVDQPKRGAMEPDVLELDDGRVLMIVRTQLGHIAASTSDDGGETWSPTYPLPLSAPEAPATLRRIPATGDLLLVWNDNFVEGAGHGGARTPLTAAISRDEGRTWQHRRNLETDPERGFAYTSLVFVQGRAVLSYYEHDQPAGTISTWFRSVPVSWFYETAAQP